MRRAVLSTWLCVFQLLLAAELRADTGELLVQVSQRLQGAASVAGEFSQRKQLHFLEVPLDSTGEFALSPQQGFVWRVLQPLDSTLLVRGSEVLLDGEPIRDYGAARLLADLMSGFMQGDLEQMAELFAVQGSITDAGWQLVLRPLSALMQQAVAQITLQGGEYLRSIEIQESGGNQTLISLTGVRNTAAAGSAPVVRN